MKNRSLAGNCGIAVFIIALVTVALAFGTPSWIVSDSRIRGNQLDRLGLWSHCFRSLPDPLDQYQRRFFVGCRWVYDPFTTGYDRILGYLLPGISGCIAVIVFACFGNTEGWMPGHPNNYFGWSFGLAVVGSVACIITAALFLTEANIQSKKRNRFKESQACFEMEHESKA
ncbi:hypothetical protein RR46_10608 [Papilio xuthus]|uniref:Sinuous n=1 Tax=Papilio xuthus TaxID=66420 RepID=A0A194PJZ9_PAPXU|nr:hypothetical protein RR46_10608 [Papilio xuthus]